MNTHHPIVERFLRYVSVDTKSDPTSNDTPSTKKQFDLAKLLKEELETLGLEDISLDDKCYLMASLPANTSKKGVPTIGFVAHMDTAPDMSGKDVKPRIVPFTGEAITLCEKEQILLSPAMFPEMNRYKGQELIVTDGHTLLGADDKAGVAAIMQMLHYFKEHPEIEHGTIRVGFTPDEEIGRGADFFDVEKFKADFAYTIDGGEIGELEYENFNAAGATIAIRGVNVHPGYAKGKMVNALLLAMELNSLLPPITPANTEGYQGFFHLIGIEGGVEDANVQYIIRDHDREKFEKMKEQLTQAVETINKRYPTAKCTLSMKDQYYNMREIVEPRMEIVNLASEAMQRVGVTPNIKPIRGGTDGSRLSFMGLPCPNIFAGGHNFHGRYEFIPIPSLIKSYEVVCEIAKLAAEQTK
ncbi:MULTISPECIES: peptidase T [Porphyromonas]|uniref:Peptidase T n=1 Tax=Porphyromonas canoris TaxID=36875 RepID=A0ABR4XLW1_9PORP|nr:MULTISPECIES: peptidase T [Porphyromonas]KGL51889.1 peptidase T [Porphyromonas canoris]KGN71924.1 peptidase T [Porphyromonas sp. COT-108 OH1349]KGN92752.1 peptidase T [Porphyromonas canoris]KGN94681.1 peptidase T [Porphyromonas sp. COT-108 OH2963]